MAANLFSSILSSALSKSQISFVNDATGTPCWTGINIADVEILTESDNSNQPMSTEQVSESSVSTSLLAVDVQSTKIMKPSKMRISALVDDLSILQNIISLFNDQTVTLTVTTKSIVSAQMSIMEVGIDQTPEMLSASRVSITLEQTFPPGSASPYDPSQSADAASYGLSVLTPQTSSSVASLFSTFTSNIGSLI